MAQRYQAPFLHGLTRRLFEAVDAPRHVADVIAEVRGVSPAEIHAQTTAAYQALFRPHHTR